MSKAEGTSQNISKTNWWNSTKWNCFINHLQPISRTTNNFSGYIETSIMLHGQLVSIPLQICLEIVWESWWIHYSTKVSQKWLPIKIRLAQLGKAYTPTGQPIHVSRPKICHGTTNLSWPRVVNPAPPDADQDLLGQGPVLAQYDWNHVATVLLWHKDFLFLATRTHM